jgi:VanZ family protein
MDSISKNAWWLATAIWAVVIFNLSGGSYSSASSQRLISQMLDWLSISIPSQTIGLMNAILRKCAHLTEYAVLAGFLYHSNKAVGESSWSGKASLWAVILSGSYSLTDEFHQMFVPGRHASILDCLIDTTGACLGLIVLSVTIGAYRLMRAGSITQLSSQQ